MKNLVKKYLLMVVISGLMLAGCDSAIEPPVEETTTESVEENVSAEVGEESAVQKTVEKESTEEQLINAEKVAALPIETVKIFEQIAAAYQNGDYIGACKYANQLGVIGEETDKLSAVNELVNQLSAAEFKVMEEPALIGTINGTVGIYCDSHTVNLYCGDFKEGKRDGTGILICHWLEHPSYAVGEWKDDMPNGKQSIYKEQRWVKGTELEINIIECSGNAVNGLWNGEVNYNVTEYIGEQIYSGEAYTVNYDNGKVKILGQIDSHNIIAYGSAYDSYENRKEDEAKFITIGIDSSDKLYGCFWKYEDIYTSIGPAVVWR